jgi:quercetin dioxygenase-like cupin family protein
MTAQDATDFLASPRTAPATPAAVPPRAAKVVLRGEGTIRYSVPGETLYFKIRGDETDGALDYFVLDVLPKSGPPLHTHRKQHETIHFLTGRYKVRAGDHVFVCEEGTFVHIPPGLKHTFLNLTDEPGEAIVTFSPGHSDRFFAEFGPAIRSFDGPPDPAVLEPIFAAADWELNGPPLPLD